MAAVKDPYEIAAMAGTKQRSHFLVCRPDHISTKIPNNVFMEGKNREPVDVKRALNQWDRIMHLFETWDVRLEEIPPTKGCQDQTFAANIGQTIYPYFIIANYKADGRACEVPVAMKFLEGLGYNVIQPPYHYEGYADLRPWKPGVFIGGYGQFTDERAYDWIEEKCGVKIIRIKNISEELYHSDCGLIVINEENIMVTKAAWDKASLKTLEGLANIIYTPEGIETTGITNGVTIPEHNVYVSGCFAPEDAGYQKAMEFLLETMDKVGYTTVFVDCDSFNPSGADCSCLVSKLSFEPTLHRV